MKRALLLLAACLFVVASASALAIDFVESPKVDANGVMLPLDTGKQITFPNGTAVTRSNIGLTNKIYIGIRADGKVGSGALLDPYDGSTPTKLDGTFRGKTNTHFILLPGVFDTNGNSFELASDARWTPGSGCTIEGTGNWLTTLRLANVPSAFHWIIGGDYNQVQNDVTIKNLVIDSNEQNQATAGWSAPIGLNGSRNKVQHCFFKNYASRNSAAEVFLCILGTPLGVDAYDNIIEDNWVGPPASGVTWAGGNAGITAFGLIGNNTSGTPRWMRNSVIRNNHANDITITGSAGDPPYFHMMGTAYCESCVLEGNMGANLLGPFGANVCIYNDTAPNSNVIYRNNTFTNVKLGAFYVNTSTVQNGIQFNENVISVAPGGSGITISGGGGHLNTNTVLRGNTIRAYGATDPTTLGGIGVYDASNVTAIDNMIDVGTTSTSFNTWNNVTLARYDRNQKSTGSPIVPWNTDSGTVRSDYHPQFTITFTPAGVGWYRIVSDATGDVGGTITLSAAYDNHFDEVELKFNIPGYGGLGSIEQLRSSFYAGQNIDQARISSNGTNGVYLDIHIASATTPGPVTVMLTGNRMFYESVVTAPTVGATTGGTSEKVLNLGPGLRTTSVSYAGGDATIGGNLTGGGSSTAHMYSFFADNGFYGNGSGLTGISALNVSCPIREVTGSTVTITSTDEYIFHDTIPGGGVIDTLPVGAQGLVFLVEDTSHTAGTNNITINTSSSQTFTGGGTSKTISTSGQGVAIRWIPGISKWCATKEDPL